MLTLFSMPSTISRGAYSPFAYDLYFDPFRSSSFFRAPVLTSNWFAAAAGEDMREPLNEWTTTGDRTSLMLRLDATKIELDSLEASLASDGKTLELKAKRVHQACACAVTSLGTVELPHTPVRAEDVELQIDEKTYPGETRLKISLPKHSAADTATQLKITRQLPSYGGKEKEAPAQPRLSGEERAAEEEAQLTNKFKGAISAVSAQQEAVSKMEEAARAAENTSGA